MLKLCTAVKAEAHIRNIIRDIRYVLKLCATVKAPAHIRNTIRDVRYLLKLCTTVKAEAHIRNTTRDVRYLLKLCTAVKAFPHIRDTIRDVRHLNKTCTTVKAVRHIRNVWHCAEFERYLFLPVAVQFLPERACTITNQVSCYVWRRKTGYLDVIDAVGLRLCAGKMVRQVIV